MSVFKFTINVFKQTSPSITLKRLVSNKVRVRFAPSPTGFLHLGGLRTALYNHLFAKSQNGETILRIEDTDLSRKVPLATENIIEDLAWFGITYDEGPYFQSERKEIYQKYANQLLEQGDAYYCFCSSIRLKLLRQEALKAGEIPKYDNCCRNLTKEEIENNFKKKQACIRFKLSSFKDTYTDLVLGSDISFGEVTKEGDPIIIKTDGFPTYHFANVVDDHLMNITHVLRGNEWLISTGKHILLYRAFNWEPPKFGHLPLLMSQDGSKLSKRQGHFHVNNLKKNGYFPLSVINFIISIGGGFDIKSDKNIITIYNLDELSEKFDLSKIKPSSGKVNFDLLSFYNKAEISRQFDSTKERQNLIKKVQEMIEKHFQNREYKGNLLLEEDKIVYVLEVLKPRLVHLEDLLHGDFEFLWTWENNWNETNEIYNDVIRSLIIQIQEVNWVFEDLREFFKKFANSFEEFKYADIMLNLRIALTGKKVGLSVPEIFYILSKEEVLFRLREILRPKSKSVVNQN